MSDANPYREVLLDHSRRPRNKGALDETDAIGAGSNPLCGDEVEIGLRFDGETIAWARFRGRGCAICIASASMLTEAVSGRRREEARQLGARLRESFGPAAPAVPEPLTPLAPVREHPARHRCVLLAWEALEQALECSRQG